jgi:uncharacterized damage-inducible protein DinB
MSVSADTLCTHLDYTAWASRRLVEAASELTPEELTRDFGTADKSVLGTLVHTFAADRVWLARMEGLPNPPYSTEADYQLQVLQSAWPALGERWRQWAAQLTDESVQHTLAYRDMRGRPWQQPVWVLLLHVVNHGTHHRGQVSGFLRSMRRTPPVLDLIYYYREVGSGSPD